MNKTIRITQKRSSIGKLRKHKATLKVLGLHRIGQTVSYLDKPHIRGMINSISYMLKIEEF